MESVFLTLFSANVDFFASFESLVFTEPFVQLNIPLFDDDIHETDENFLVRMGEPLTENQVDGVNIVLDSTEVLITIVDNDGKCMCQML